MCSGSKYILALLSIILANCAEVGASADASHGATSTAGTPPNSHSVCFVQAIVTSKPRLMSNIAAHFYWLENSYADIIRRENGIIQMPRLVKDHEDDRLEFVFGKSCDVFRDEYRGASVDAQTKVNEQSIRSTLNLTEISRSRQTVASGRMEVFSPPSIDSFLEDQQGSCSRELQFPGLRRSKYSANDAALILKTILNEFGVRGNAIARDEDGVEVRLDELCGVSNILIEAVIYEAQRISPSFQQYGGSWALGSGL